MISLANVTKCFNAGKPNQFRAVNDVSLTIDTGRVTVLKGPSGSGKTTLLSLIGCMARPTAGRISIHGINPSFLSHSSDADVIDIASLPERFLTFIRRQTFGFIFQQYNLIQGITVLENIMLPAVPLGEKHAVLRQRVQVLLDSYELTRLQTSRVENLSGGEQQRVAIARALINNPAVIIADEPTAHLDSRLSADFMQTISDLRCAGKTVLIASHDPLVFNSAFVDRVVEMRDGRITTGDSSP